MWSNLLHPWGLKRHAFPRDCTLLSSRKGRSFRRRFSDAKTIQGCTGDWEVVIGLEIHAQLNSKSKLFSDAPVVSSTEFRPNSSVSVVDAGFPGTLPVLNKYCVEQAIRLGHALQGRVNTWSAFDRKHYFYADLPNSYQITQYRAPIVTGGSVSIKLANSNEKKDVGISHIQLEQDSGKSLHDQHPEFTLIDLNRAGVGLVEIVTKPDIRSSEEAAAFLAKLQHLLVHTGVSNANMEQGEIRCDVNVSVNKPGERRGERCEIKNMNSIKFISKAIEAEARRQIDLLENGLKVERHTLAYNVADNTTTPSRRKEDEVDYRFMPEPDLPPLTLKQEFIDEIRNAMPAMPDVIEDRLVNHFKLKPYDADVIVRHHAMYYFEEVWMNEMTYFVEVVKEKRNPQKVASWIINNLFGILHNNEGNIPISQSPVTPVHLGDIIDLTTEGYISDVVGKEVMQLIFEGDKRTAKEIVDQKGWGQQSDVEGLRSLCKQVLENNPNELNKHRSGNTRMMKHFMGQVMKLSQGKANPKLANDILEELLKN